MLWGVTEAIRPTISSASSGKPDTIDTLFIRLAAWQVPVWEQALQLPEVLQALKDLYLSKDLYLLKAWQEQQAWEEQQAWPVLPV